MLMKLGIVDTMFSRVDMGAIAIDELKKRYPGVLVVRRTVPGIKDLAVECKKLLDDGCDSCLALGMVGGAPIDTQCGHEASLGIQQAKLMCGKHIIEVFVHENEAWDEAEFDDICQNRVRKHAVNAVEIVTDPDSLTARAGNGIRQGKEDEGRIVRGRKRSVRLAIVVARFNGDITSRMEREAITATEKRGADYVVVHVPGVYDMPLAVRKALMDKKIDAVAVLGAVVKGDTAHDKVITEDVARRLGDLSGEFRKPVTLGIIGHGAKRPVAALRAEPYASHAVSSAVYMVGLMRDWSEGPLELGKRH